MIEKLTPEQEAAIQPHVDMWLSKVFDYKFTHCPEEEIVKANKRIYEISELAEPNVLVCDSPIACQIMANICKEIYENGGDLSKVKVSDHDLSITPENLKGIKESFSFSSYINYSDFGWLSHYDYFDKHLGIVDNEYLADVIFASERTFMSIQLEEVCIVSRYPEFISRNENDDLHNTSQEAIRFRDGYKQYYVNGRFIEAETFEKITSPQSAREVFEDSDNADVQAIISTIVLDRWGNEGLLQMLDAEVVDEQTIVHANGYQETQRLIKSKKSYEWASDSQGNDNVKLAWNEMTCPSTGTTYLISTCPTFDNVIDSAKWLRPDGVPTNVDYVWQSAN